MALDAGTAYVDIQPQVGKGFFASLSGKMGGLKAVGLAGGAALAAGIGAGFAAFKLGETFDAAYDDIIVATGATGDALDGLKDDFREVFTTTATSAGDAATAIGEINTRLGTTGEPLVDISKRIIDLSRITKTDLAGNIDNITRLFGDWGVETEDQAGALDTIFEATKRTGVGLGRLTGLTVQYGAPLRQLGFGFEEATALIGKFDKEGVNTETILGGLRQGLAKLAKTADDVPAAFQETVDAIKEAGTQGEANAIAMEVFGARAGPDMAAAVREGRFEIDEMVAGLKNSGGALDDAVSRTESFSEKWQKLVNQAMVALEPIATRVFNALGEAMDWIAPKIGPLIDNIGAFASIISETLSPALAVVSDLFSTVFGFFSEATEVGVELPGAWGGIWDQVVAIFQDAKVLIDEVLLAIQAFWEAHGETIMETVSKVWDTIGTTIEGALQFIRGIIQVITAIFQGDWSLAWEGIKNIVSGAVKVVTSTIERAWELIKLAFRLGISAIKLVWMRLWNSIKSLASTAWDGFTSWVEGIWDTFTGWWAGAWEGLGEFVEGAFSGVAGAVKSVLNGVLGALEEGINAALRALNRAIDYADVIAGPFINFPDNPVKPVSIPRLHDGGQVALPGLVNMKPGEEIVGLPSGATVVPLDKLDGGGRPYTITMVLDGRTIAQATGRHLVDDITLHTGVKRA